GVGHVTCLAPYVSRVTTCPGRYGQVHGFDPMRRVLEGCSPACRDMSPAWHWSGALGQVRRSDPGNVTHKDLARGYSGMFPCLRRGRGSCFVSAVSNASMSTGLVRLGSITSST